MGTLNATPTCTDVVLTWDGAGLFATIATPTLDEVGPLDVDGTLSATPDTVYTLTWYGPSSDGTAVVEWGSTTITTPGLLTDCELQATTTAPVPTPTEARSSSTPASTLPPASVPATTSTTLALDLDSSACDQAPGDCVATTIAPTGPTLPATGGISDGLPVVGVSMLLAGVLALAGARLRGAR